MFVYDRDTTPIYPKNQSQNRFVGNMMTNDSWINEMFTVEHSFKEEKAIFGNVRGTVHEFCELSSYTITLRAGFPDAD